MKSLSARYLLVGPGYRALRRWKVSQGPIFDRQILIPDAAQLDLLRSMSFDSIVPIPQRLKRSWSLGGSPAARIAQWLGRQLGIRCVDALIRASYQQQAELSMEERMKNRVVFELEPDSQLGERVLLVDDFFTTGKTLAAAANLLATRSGEVHAFCLGLRPRLNRCEDLRRQG